MSALYHYCSTNNFASIIETHSIRLSSLTQSNDYMEGKLVASIIETLAEADDLSLETTQQLKDAAQFLEDFADGLGFCLSEKGDLLSQWRGYADDAHGVSIGFSRQYLEWLSESRRQSGEFGVSLMKVEYDPSTHLSSVEPTYRKIKEFIDSGAFKLPGRKGLLDNRTDDEVEREDKEIILATRNVYFTALTLFDKLFALKTKAFIEEHEWRLISYLVSDTQDSCFYRPHRNRIVPYREITLTEMPRRPIERVVLGPKHQTPVAVVEGFLKKYGFNEVDVVPSAASYR